MIGLLLCVLGGVVGASGGYLSWKLGRGRHKARERRVESIDYVGILPPPVAGSLAAQTADIPVPDFPADGPVR